MELECVSSDLPPIPTGTPPFELILDPNLLLCAQIRGTTSSDAYLIDFLKKEPKIGPLFLDLLIYERSFIHTMKQLNDHFEGKISSDYKFLSVTLGKPITQLSLMHSFFIQAFDKFFKDPQDFVTKAVRHIVQKCNVIPAHQEYLVAYADIETLVLSYSHDYPNIFDTNQTTLHCFKAPQKWLEYLINFCSQLSNYLINEKMQSCFENIQEFSKSCKNVLESIDSQPLLENVARNFLIEPFPIVEPGRRLIKVGNGLKHCRKDVTERVFILFSDFFVYAQPKGGKWLIPSAYHLTKMRVEVCATECLSIFTPRKSFVIEFSSNAERDEWLRCIIQAVANIMAGKHEPDFTAAPIWIPDNKTQKCMICQTEHTFFVRRHHCRACGCVACSNCLRFRAIVEGVSSSPVRVCEECYKKLCQNQLTE